MSDKPSDDDCDCDCAEIKRERDSWKRLYTDLSERFAKLTNELDECVDERRSCKRCLLK